MVREAFTRCFTDFGDTGASVCFTVEGETVVDLWGGFRDAAHESPWTEDTLAVVWSATKGITTTAVHMLVDRGQLDLDAPVATYWPEFGQAGKDTIPVRYLLSHQAGLAGARHIAQTQSR